MKNLKISVTEICSYNYLYFTNRGGIFKKN